MKKLMIAVAIVCAAAMSQASTIRWKLGTSALNDGTGATSATTMSTVYLFNAVDYSQQALLDDIFKNSKSFADIQAKAKDSASLSSGKMTDFQSVTKAWGNNDSSSGTEMAKSYVVVFNEAANTLFINETKSVGYNQSQDPSATTDMAAQTYFSDSKQTFSLDASKAANAFATNGGGWYTAQSVPEPTSGLLLLLGVAGLALRRRRA